MIFPGLPKEIGGLVLMYLENKFFGRLEIVDKKHRDSLKKELPVLIYTPAIFLKDGTRQKIAKGEEYWIRNLSHTEGENFLEATVHLSSRSQLFTAEMIFGRNRIKRLRKLDFKVQYDLVLCDRILSGLKEVVKSPTLKNLRVYDEGQYPSYFFSDLVWSRDIINTPIYSEYYSAARSVCSRIAEDIRGSWVCSEDRLWTMIDLCERVGRYDLVYWYKKNMSNICEDGRFLCNSEWYGSSATYSDFKTVGVDPSIMDYHTPDDD